MEQPTQGTTNDFNSHARTQNPNLKLKGIQLMARDDFRFQRGEYVRDKITGFSGVVISRIDSITGCDPLLRPARQAK